MPHISQGRSLPPSPTLSSASAVNTPAVSTPAPQGHEGPVSSVDAVPQVVDQSQVSQHAAADFEQASVNFPEPLPEREQELAGFGEILGGLAAMMVPGGAPSSSLGPVIQQAEKNLQERRSVKPQQPVKIDTAASSELSDSQ